MPEPRKRPHDEWWGQLRTSGMKDQGPPREGLVTTLERLIMATPTLVPAKVAEAPKPKTIEVYNLKAVHGLLIHPYTHTRFVPDKALSHEIDGWCKSQIEAGKLVVV